MPFSQQRSSVQGGSDIIRQTMSLVRRSFLILLYVKMLISAEVQVVERMEPVPVVEPVIPTISVVESSEQASLFLEPVDTTTPGPECPTTPIVEPVEQATPVGGTSRSYNSSC